MSDTSRPQTPHISRDWPSPYRCGHHTGPEPLRPEIWDPKFCWPPGPNFQYNLVCFYCASSSMKSQLAVMKWRYEVLVLDLTQGSDELSTEASRYRSKAVQTVPVKNDHVASIAREKEIAELRLQYYGEVHTWSVNWRKHWGNNGHELIQDYLDKAERQGDETLSKTVRVLKRPET